MKNIRQFEIILEITRQGSISGAAETLGVSQPTLSKLVHKLEEELGLELFDRRCIPLKLTTAGECYIDAATQIMDVHHRLDKQLERIRTGTSTEVRLGISPSRASYILPEVLTEFRRLVPSGKITILETNTSQLNATLTRGDLDLIISLPGDGTSMFHSLPLFSETTLLAAPRNMDGLTAEEILRTRPLITVGRGQLLWNTLRVILDSLGRQEVELECTSVESAIALVRGGFGATLVPSYLADDRNYRKAVRFLRLPEEYYRALSYGLERQVCLFYRENSVLTAAEQQFIRACITISERRKQNGIPQNL